MSRKKPPIEPLWPFGCVAHLTLGIDGRLKVTQLPIVEVTKIADGWEVLAHKSRDEDLLFELDVAGESTTCVPWDETLEADYQDFYYRRLAASQADAEVGELVDDEELTVEFFEAARREADEARTHLVFPQRTDDASTPQESFTLGDVFLYLPRLTGAGR